MYGSRTAQEQSALLAEVNRTWEATGLCVNDDGRQSYGWLPQIEIAPRWATRRQLMAGFGCLGLNHIDVSRHRTWMVPVSCNRESYAYNDLTGPITDSITFRFVEYVYPVEKTLRGELSKAVTPAIGNGSIHDAVINAVMAVLGRS